MSGRAPQDARARLRRTVCDAEGSTISSHKGRLGTKVGAGFFTYTPEERDRLLLERDRRYAALNELLARLPPLTAGTSNDERN